MARHGDLYENNVTGERAVVLRGDEAPGLPTLVHLTVRPGGFVAGEHVHPALTERFTVISGVLTTRIGGADGRLERGEEAVVAPGVAHDWWNAGDEDAHVLVELSPPSERFEQAIATGFGLANTGRHRRLTGPHGSVEPDPVALATADLGSMVESKVR
jgi:quercetin dioxygenase-like cupin family protein